jgi:hypothetical protein
MTDSITYLPIPELSTYKIHSGINLIGITGHAGAGKDTIKDFLLSTYKNYYSLAFAEPLKAAASVAFGIPLEDFSDPATKELDNDFWNVSPRSIAQFVGTEMFRETMGKLIPETGSDFWIKRAAMRLNNVYVPAEEGEFSEGDTVVIPDVRFQNEYDFIVGNGGVVIHVTRPGATGSVGLTGHASEAGFNMHNYERNYLCENNSTLGNLYKSVANIIIATKY